MYGVVTIEGEGAQKILLEIGSSVTGTSLPQT